VKRTQITYIGTVAKLPSSKTGKNGAKKTVVVQKQQKREKLMKVKEFNHH